MSKNKVDFTNEHKSLTLTAEIRGTNATLKIYPAKSDIKTKKEAEQASYKNDKPLVIMEFKNQISFNGLIEFLKKMRDDVLFAEGQSNGVAQANEHWATKLTQPQVEVLDIAIPTEILTDRLADDVISKLRSQGKRHRQKQRMDKQERVIMREQYEKNEAESTSGVPRFVEK